MAGPGEALGRSCCSERYGRPPGPRPGPEHAPSDAELARHLGVTDEELQEARQADMFFHTSSLDAPLTGGRPSRLADLLGADDPELGGRWT